MIEIKLEKSIWIVLVFIFTNAFYSQNNVKQNLKTFTVRGNIKSDITDNFAYLYYNDIQDSVKIINKQFEFKGSVKDTVVAKIYLPSAANAPQFYLENNTINISVSVDKTVKDGKSIQTMHIDTIKGSHSLELQKQYLNFYKSNSGKKDFNSLLYSELTVFFTKHRTHPFSGAILAELAFMNPILNKQQLTKLYSILDLSKQDDQYLKLYQKGIEKLDVYAVGKPFLDFKLPNQDGNLINLKDYKGKIVLIDFWASWCAPCRKKNPELISLKQQFENADFEIIGISRDKNKKQWISAIAKDKLEWTNLLDEDQKMENSMGIENIPYNYLLDEKGIILGVNLPVEKITQILTDKVKTQKS
ncbi:TlpA disulfide reductase family protein [Flavobacterium sp. DG2-3]|uniref:TlpA disulfide reductase family protein n=1 Tax=Flavobacterium sp. DG2-3 TaxID=3068317 RepID=UPI00273FDA03|nr:TlpA disulfide reductase family protein [Flavobacterium sp. DG2-3]MDP5199090.1 TlpA disulfide reductase family protein [Flavobacterium sp. DG2-3]